ncbi:hypothetical protein AQJ11_02725 [Streptomyces corchorusii]|uniref:Uncharacterized protein n=1 Tax=Streptomyces corchorusii TaxID=1903 RepID=A0A124HPJ7_STRCK|nr:hypothetical protein AQJ11_02725 [Streptomyces corchorusii]
MSAIVRAGPRWAGVPLSLGVGSSTRTMPSRDWVSVSALSPLALSEGAGLLLPLAPGMCGALAGD